METSVLFKELIYRIYNSCLNMHNGHGSYHSHLCVLCMQAVEACTLHGKLLTCEYLHGV